MYTYANNDQVYKGDIGPLMGLMLWPQTDDAKDYLTPAGTRRRLTALAASTELDNPYFNVAKNKINSKTNRLIANVGFIVARSEEHTSELQSQSNLVCRLLLEKKKKK